MATKIFSSRADEQMIAFADSLAQREYGMSFGKYCGTVLLPLISETKQLPKLQVDIDQGRIEALNAIKTFAECPHDASVAALSDREIEELIGGRYA